MIAIIDYDAGNIKSVEKALQFLGEEVVITRDRDVILSSERAVLPGVGSFGDAMDKINEYGLKNVITDFVETGKPFLGICLGLQILFKDSEESKGVAGLGILDGHILRLPDNDPRTGDRLKVPQIGWNSLDITEGAKLFKGLKNEPYVYFVHSYYLKADDPGIVAGRTYYGTEVHASVEKGNVFACQFHPEKSSEVGLTILKNFISL